VRSTSSKTYKRSVGGRDEAEEGEAVMAMPPNEDHIQQARLQW
jgi:hypothetical protein